MTTFEDYFANKTAGNPLTGAGITLSGNIEEDMDANGLSKGREGLAMLGLIYAAALVPGSTIQHPFTTINDIVITVKYPRNYVPVMTTDQNPVPVRANNSANGLPPTYVPPRGVDNEYGDYTLANIANCPDLDAKSMLQSVVGGNSDWKTFFYDLLAAHQVKSLSANNVRSYFAWKKSPDIEGELIARKFSSITGGMPQIATNDVYRSNITAGRWTDYRLTFASSVGLFDKMLIECPQDYLSVFSNETKDSVRYAALHSYSENAYRAIPEKALGIMYAYLIVTDQVVGELQGPKRAYDNLTVNDKESLKKWFAEAKTKLTVYQTGWFTIGRLPASLANT